MEYYALMSVMVGASLVCVWVEEPRLQLRVPRGVEGPA